MWKNYTNSTLISRFNHRTFNLISQFLKNWHTLVGLLLITRFVDFHAKSIEKLLIKKFVNNFLKQLFFQCFNFLSRTFNSMIVQFFRIIKLRRWCNISKMHSKYVQIKNSFHSYKLVKNNNITKTFDQLILIFSSITKS